MQQQSHKPFNKIPKIVCKISEFVSVNSIERRDIEIYDSAKLKKSKAIH